MKKRTHRTEREKAKIALEALRNERPLKEIAKRHKLYPSQITRWRTELLEHAHEVFERGKKSRDRTEEYEDEIRQLYEQIGRLKVENDFLKKKSTE